MAFALVVLFLAMWALIIDGARKMVAHESLPAHAEIDREFRVIQHRYECLQNYPDQTPEELALCDRQAREAYPMPGQQP